MTDALYTAPAARPAPLVRSIAPRSARIALLAVAVAALAAGFTYTSSETTARAVTASGEDLARLLRFMALLKTMMAVMALAAVAWRLGVAVPMPWLVAYAAAGGAMAAGPGLIWGMAHVALGAACLHGGLFATLLLLWRDPAVAARLSSMLKARAAARDAA